MTLPIVLALVPLWLQGRVFARLLCPQSLNGQKQRLFVSYILSTIHAMGATACVIARSYYPQYATDASRAYLYFALSYFFYDLLYLYAEDYIDEDGSRDHNLPWSSSRRRVVATFTVHHIVSIFLLTYFSQDMTICPIMATTLIALEIPVLLENAYQIARLFYGERELKYLIYTRFLLYIYVRLWKFWDGYQQEREGRGCRGINEQDHFYYLGWALFMIQWVFVASMGRDMLR